MYIFFKFAKPHFINIVPLILLMLNESVHLPVALAALEIVNSSRRCRDFTDLFSPLPGPAVDRFSPTTVSQGR